MNPVDLTFLIVLMLTILIGIVRGFVRQLIQIAGVVTGFLLAYKYCSPFSDFLITQLKATGLMAMILAFVGIFVATVMTFGILAFFFRDALKKARLQSYDKLMGGILGALKGLLMCAILYFLASHLPGKTWHDKIEIKLKAAKSRPVLEIALKQLKHMFPNEYRDIEDKLQKEHPSPPKKKGAPA